MTDREFNEKWKGIHRIQLFLKKSDDSIVIMFEGREGYVRCTFNPIPVVTVKVNDKAIEEKFRFAEAKNKNQPKLGEL